jgi:hypothetical protein
MLKSASPSGAVSSAVEHCLHTAGATGSIPVPPTSGNPPPGLDGRLVDVGADVNRRARHIPRVRKSMCAKPSPPASISAIWLQQTTGVLLTSAPSRAPLSTPAHRTQRRRLSGVQPVLLATERIAAHCDSCSPWCSRTSRTARSWTSGENFVGLLIRAPPSQEMELPTNPGRFSFAGGLPFSRVVKRWGDLRGHIGTSVGKATFSGVIADELQQWHASLHPRTSFA